MFGATALNQPVNYWREWGEKVQGIGKILETNKDQKDSLKLFSSLKGQVKMQAMLTIKSLSGLSYTDKQQEGMEPILPDIGPGTVKSVFDGRIDNLQRLYKGILARRKELLAKGIKVGDPEYEAEMRPFVNQQLGEMLGSSKLPSEMTDEELMAAHKKLGGK